MPRVALAVADIVIGGINAADDGQTPTVDNFYLPNNGRQMIGVYNGDASSKTVTIQSYPRGDAPGGLTVSDKTVVVEAGKTELIGPFPPSIYNNASNQVEIDLSAVTAVKVKGLKFVANPG